MLSLTTSEVGRKPTIMSQSGQITTHSNASGRESLRGYLPCFLAPHNQQAFISSPLILHVRELTNSLGTMISSLVPFLATLGAFASYASASAQATPAALARQAQTPSTLTLSLTLSPSVPGGPTSEETLTITLNPTPNGGPAFTAPPPGVSPEPAVPDDTPPCASLDALVSSCTTLSSFYGLPLSAQAQCLCNVGPWDAVVSSCFDQLTVLGQYYASSLTSHGLLGLCSTYSAGPTWPTSVIANTSATTTSAATATNTSIGTINSSTGSSTVNATKSATHTTTQITPTSSGSFSLARPSLLVWLLPWLLAL
jgi:hypothetical protein